MADAAITKQASDYKIAVIGAGHLGTRIAGRSVHSHKQVMDKTFKIIKKFINRMYIILIL